MGVNLATSSTSVSISGSVANSIPVPSSDQTIKFVQGQGDNNINTVATVTAGKTAYVMYFSHGAGAVGIGYLYDTDGATAIIKGFHIQDCTTVHSCGVPLAQYEAGEFIKVRTTNGHEYTVIYYEE
jgi:hypothetical protein